VQHARLGKSGAACLAVCLPCAVTTVLQDVVAVRAFCCSGISVCSSVHQQLWCILSAIIISGCCAGARGINARNAVVYGVHFCRDSVAARVMLVLQHAALHRCAVSLTGYSHSLGRCHASCRSVEALLQGLVILQQLPLVGTGRGLVATVVVVGCCIDRGLVVSTWHVVAAGTRAVKVASWGRR